MDDDNNNKIQFLFKQESLYVHIEVILFAQCVEIPIINGLVIHSYTLIPPWENQCECHRMTRVTGPDCAVVCNLINIHTYILVLV